MKYNRVRAYYHPPFGNIYKSLHPIKKELASLADK